MPDSGYFNGGICPRRTSRGFGGKRVHALQGVDISVERGEIVGILGPNGAGKTTFLKILLGIVSPTGGGSAMADGVSGGKPRVP